MTSETDVAQADEAVEPNSRHQGPSDRLPAKELRSQSLAAVNHTKQDSSVPAEERASGSSAASPADAPPSESALLDDSVAEKSAAPGFGNGGESVTAGTLASPSAESGPGANDGSALARKEPGRFPAAPCLPHSSEAVSRILRSERTSPKVSSYKTARAPKIPVEGSHSDPLRSAAVGDSSADSADQAPTASPALPPLETSPNAIETLSGASDSGVGAAAGPASPGMPVPLPEGTENAESAPADMPAESVGYEELTGGYSELLDIKAGDIRRGQVVSVSAEGVVVDIGGKTEGIVPLDDFRNEAGEAQVESGEEIDVLVRNPGALGDYALLSYRRARERRIWDKIEQALRGEETLVARVVERVKGGLKVDVGLPAFLPGSQVDLRLLHDLDSLVGQEIPVRVLKTNRRRGNIVVSRRALLEEEIDRLKQQTLAELHEGGVVTGRVKNVTDYGAFVDLGGVDGLIHLTDLSYGRIKGPSEVLKTGDEVTAKVLKFDPEKERVSLSLKQMKPDPWEGVGDRYQKGQRVQGRVAGVSDYGVFVELEPGVEGLIHVSETTWSRRVRHPSKVFRTDETVEAIILRIDQRARKISLSVKQLRPDPWMSLSQQYLVGTVVKGRVRNLTSYGAFVEVEEGVDGLLHVSDLAWDNRIKHPKEMLKKGQQIEAVVLHIDLENRRLSLGLKQLQPDAWETFFSTHLAGDIVSGRITRVVKFGTFVELAPGVEGLCHSSEMSVNSHKKRTAPLRIGQEHRFKIIKLDEFDKKIGLSHREIEEDSCGRAANEPGVRAAEEQAEEVTSQQAKSAS